MTLFNRGIQSYVLLVSVVVLTAILWWGSTYLLDNTLIEVGWPVLVGSALLVIGGIVGLRRVFATTENEDRDIIPYSWNSRE